MRGCNSWDREAKHDVSDELRLRQVRVPDEEVVGEDGELTRVHLVEARFERHGLFFIFLNIKTNGIQKRLFEILRSPASAVKASESESGESVGKRVGEPKLDNFKI